METRVCDTCQQLFAELTCPACEASEIDELESRLAKQAEVIKELESKLATSVAALGMIADDDGMSYMISGTHAYDIAKKALEKLNEHFR